MKLPIKRAFRGIDIVRPIAAAWIFREVLNDADPIDQMKEHFWAMGVSGNDRIKWLELVSLGSLNQAIVQPRECYRRWILMHENGEDPGYIIFGHNHPSGVVEISQEDRNISRHLARTSALLEIPMLDHIVIGLPDDRAFASIFEIMPELRDMVYRVT